MQSVGTLYQVGATLWRVPMTHFTTIDCNWPGRLPEGAEAPDNDDPENEEDKCDPTKAGASFIGCGNATLGEAIAITGTPWQLHYMSNRVTGWRTAKELTIHLTKATPPAPLK